MNYADLFNRILTGSYIHGPAGVDYSITLSGTKVTILFQGSTTTEDWLHNFYFIPKAVKPYKNMSKVWFAHAGFVNMYHAVRDDILLAIEPYKAYSFVVAGHSQGGALAQLCTEDLIFHGIPADMIQCITYGSPRVFYGCSAKNMIRALKVDASI